MRSPSAALRLAKTGFACAALLVAARLGAEAMDFTQGLSPGERTASGVTKLAAPQVRSLDQLVARDITLARQGGVTGFSSAFLARHSQMERTAAGIGLLDKDEQIALDRFVSRAIALGPPPDQRFRYAPPAPSPTPSPVEAEVALPPKMEVHGDVSFIVGGGSHGQSFYGTSMNAYLTDPKHGFSVGVGFSQFRGKGLLDLCSPYGPYAQVYEGPTNQAW